MNPHGTFNFHSIFGKQPGKPMDWIVGGLHQPAVHEWFPQESVFFNMKNEEKRRGLEHNKYRRANNLMHIHIKVTRETWDLLIWKEYLVPLEAQKYMHQNSTWRNYGKGILADAKISISWNTFI